MGPGVLRLRVSRWARLGAAYLVIAGVVMLPGASRAAEAPPAGNLFALQTNGPNGLVTLGDWYTSTTAGAGAGYHYVRFTVPCGWPASLPVYVDLFSPEMNQVSGAAAQSEEPNGAYDSTQFELYGPGATIGPGYASPGPGTGIPGTQTTFQPGAAGVPEAWMRYATLAAPVTCGSYLVRSEVLTVDPLNPAGTGNDQNGWRIRVGTDSDLDPTNAPPVNYDDPDGLVGTNDELTLGVDQATFQQDSGGLACQTFFEYVSPGQASVIFHNFDMDGNTRVRYYAPSDTSYVPDATSGGVLGTLSSNGLWNGGTLATRVGDTILGPESGWWRVVTCISSQNQFIQEGEAGRAAYYTQPPTPNLTMAKSDGFATISPGQAVTYTIDVNNTSTGATAGAANAVVIQDTLPSEFTYGGCAIPTPAQGTWSCSEAAGVVTFTQTGWINAGASAQLTVTATLNQGASGSKTNTAVANYQDQIGNPFAPVTATDVDTVVASSDLAITKTDGLASVIAGASTTYTITVINNGPSTVPAGVVISDAIPAGTSGSESEADCAIAAGVFTCTTTAALAPSGSVSYQLTLTLDPDYPGASLSNTASITSSPYPDPVPGNDSATDTDTVTTSADLAITKSDGVASVIAGTSTTYTITVTNNGPSTVPAGVVISDPIPAGTSGSESEADCAISAGTFACTTTVALAPSASVSYQLTLTLSASYALPTLANTASITSSPVPDPDASNDSATDTDTVTTSADLSITKTDSADPVDPGTSFFYTLTVVNNGPSDASGLTVTDTVPAGFTISSVTSGLGSCGNLGNLATCTLASLALSDTWTITINVDVDLSTGGGLYTDTATVSATTSDPVPGNNTDTEGTVVTPAGDLSITKTDGVASVIAGTSTTFTITVTNNGPSTVPAGVVISDAIPANTTGSELDADCVIAAGVFTCTTTAAMLSGGSVSYQLTLTLDPDYPAPTLVNTASVSSSPIPDPFPANDTDTDTDTVTGSADLAITKSDGLASVIAGASTTYTITVINNGPSTVPAGVVISDPIPAGTSGSESEADCAIAAGVFTCTTTAALAPSGSVSYQLTLTLDPDYPGASLSNTASITSSPYPDPVPGNDSATDTDTVTTSADLAITKSDGVASVIAGTSTTYTITVTNNGPSTVPAGVVISDAIPAGTSGSESEADCAISAGTFACTTTVALAPSASVSYQLTLTLSASYALPTLANTASITSSPVPDPDASNDSATDTDTVTTSADLSITKTDSADPVDPGTSFFYTLTVVNNGPSDASGLTVTDTVPAGFTISSVTSGLGSCGNLGNLATCTLASLALSDTWTITINVDVDLSTGGGLYTDTATVSATTSDPVPGNNTDTEGTVVTPAGDLSITKTDGVASVIAGTSTTFTITVTNNGPSTVPAGVVISDAIPANTTGSELDADCVIAAGVFTCTTTAAMLSGGSVSYQLTLTLDPDYPAPTLVNTASVSSSPIPDPFPANDTDTDTDTVTGSADLAITKSDASDPVAAGDDVTYTLSVTNNGPSDAAAAVVTDTLPGSVVLRVRDTESGLLLAGGGGRYLPAGNPRVRRDRNHHDSGDHHDRRRHHRRRVGDIKHAGSRAGQQLRLRGHDG